MKIQIAIFIILTQELAQRVTSIASQGFANEDALTADSDATRKAERSFLQASHLLMRRSPAVENQTSVDHTNRSQWVFCAEQFMTCECPGRIRWGTTNRWKVFEPSAEVRVCAPDKLGDPAPGFPGKHCQCEVQMGSSLWSNLSPPALMEKNVRTPEVSCAVFRAAAAEKSWTSSEWRAVKDFCSVDQGNVGHSLVEQEKAANSLDTVSKAGVSALKNQELQQMLDAWVDPRFLANYKRVYGKDGFVKRAFVNYVGNSPTGQKYAKMMEQLIRSIHAFSAEPIIVVHFGMTVPPEWDASRYPRLVVLDARPLPQSDSKRSFNFNKFRAMILARVQTGVVLDSDEFVAPGVDAIFTRTEEEINDQYPMPILPVHFLSDKGPKDGGSWWPRYCHQDDCPLQTMRWGHAHPTWTLSALPFIGRWLRRNLRDEQLPNREGFDKSAIRVLDVTEDEDLLNVALWEEGGTKQWCKFDVPDPTDFNQLLSTRPYDLVGRDKRFYPDGAPIVFYTAHHAVRPDQSKNFITDLIARQESGDLPPPISFHGRFYKDSHELMREFPHLGCLI